MDDGNLIDLVFDADSTAARVVVAGFVRQLNGRGRWRYRVRASRPAKSLAGPSPSAVLTCCAPGDDATRVCVKLARPQANGEDAIPVQFHVDRAAVLALAADHFAGCGIDAIAVAAARPVKEASAWEQAAREMPRLGAKTADRLHLPHATGSRAHQLRKLVAWIRSLPNPVGIVAPSDADGLALIEACRRANRSVPTEVAILGVGNDELACETESPTLSSIDLGLNRLGQEVARALVGLAAQAAGSPVPPSSALPPLLVVSRGSTNTLAVGDEIVAAATRVLRANLADPPATPQLARRLGLSRASLERRFKAALGRSIHSQLLRLRLEEARRLLLESSQSMQAVAGACGFGTLSYLTTVMRRECGLTPAQLREAATQASRRGPRALAAPRD
jgi:LacI family transcriptional regulator